MSEQAREIDQLRILVQQLQDDHFEHEKRLFDLGWRDNEVAASLNEVRERLNMPAFEPSTNDMPEPTRGAMDLENIMGKFNYFQSRA